MTPTTVTRYDVAAIGSVERTPQGFIRAPAFLTRTGVLTYRRADGSTVRELRHPDEVFAKDSLATLRAAPLTDLHPATMVSPKNVRSLAIGHVSDDVAPSGQYVAGHVTVQDADAIAAVERGDRRELSAGYTCDLEDKPGTYEGQPYDAVQRKIRYNHVGIGPRQWGRAGAAVALRLDSGNDDHDDDTIVLDAADALATSTAPAPEHVAELDTLRGELEHAAGERDALRAELDAAQAELGKQRDDADKVNRERVHDAAIRKAQRIRGKLRTDGLTTRQIHEAVLRACDRGFDAAPHSDEYVRARFDALPDRNPSSEHVRLAARGERPEQLALTPEPSPWTQPLAAHKAR